MFFTVAKGSSEQKCSSILDWVQNCYAVAQQNIVWPQDIKSHVFNQYELQSDESSQVLALLCELIDQDWQENEMEELSLETSKEKVRAKTRS